MCAKSGVIFHHVDKKNIHCLHMIEGSMHTRNMIISLTLSQLPKSLVKVDMKIETETGGGREEDRLY